MFISDGLLAASQLVNNLIKDGEMYFVLIRIPLVIKFDIFLCCCCRFDNQRRNSIWHVIEAGLLTSYTKFTKISFNFFPL